MGHLGSLKKIYDHDKLDYQSKRLNRLLQRFRQSYPKDKPAVFHAPGRVNLIGEHTDYNGLPVIPMAIDLDILIVCGFRKDHRVFLKSSSGYPDARFTISCTITRSAQGSWVNYVKAAAQALQRYVYAVDKSIRLKGFNAIVDGNIPAGCGLSSSTALVVCTALILNEINGLDMDKHLLADLMARGERYVGTQGGGMDQAASLFGETNHALFIEFFPMRIQKVTIPDEYAIVVCNSLITAEKSASKRNDYNRRVIECRLGVAMINRFLAHTVGLACSHPSGDDADPLQVKFSSSNYMGSTGQVNTHIFRLGDLNSDDLPGLINDAFDRESYSLKDISRYCDRSEESLLHECMKLDEGIFRDNKSYLYKVKRRCRHVLLEGRRVYTGKHHLISGDMAKFGKLMNESHLSCDQDYEISCPELNQLTAICRNAGAVGARLTGAGFGGCVVSIIQKDYVEKFLNFIEDEYYKIYLKDEHPELSRDLDIPRRYMHVLKPSKGAVRII